MAHCSFNIIKHFSGSKSLFHHHSPCPAYLPILVRHSVDAVLVDPPPDSRSVYLIVGEVVIETDVVILILQLVRNVGIEWDEDEELPGAAAPGEAAGTVAGAK